MKRSVHYNHMFQSGIQVFSSHHSGFSCIYTWIGLWKPSCFSFFFSLLCSNTKLHTNQTACDCSLSFWSFLLWGLCSYKFPLPWNPSFHLPWKLNLPSSYITSVYLRCRFMVSFLQPSWYPCSFSFVNLSGKYMHVSLWNCHVLSMED
jgi:hypothetical protein